MVIARSVTAIIHGRGVDVFKWVSGLNKREKEFLKSGGYLFTKSKKYHYTQSGYKILSYKSGRYIHREPTDHSLRLIHEYEKGVKKI